MKEIYVDKIEIFPEERRGYVIYRKSEDAKWPKGKSKYEILLLRILSYDVKHWPLVIFYFGTNRGRT